MTDWCETYRGSVAPWECDVTEHFTIAYYFDRLDEAEANLAESLGLVELWQAGGFPRRYDCRFARELRAGSAFHIESAPLGLDGGLRLGHRVVDSTEGGVLTWFDTRWEVTLDAAAGAAIRSRLAAWDGPPAEARTAPPTRTGFIPTACGRVGPGDLGETGRMSLAAIIHKFTDASIQAGAAVGLTADYIIADRRAFSTFELALAVSRDVCGGQPFAIETGLLHLGNSSLRFLHVMIDPRDGTEIARLGQYGVQLDLDARRPAALAPELRARAEKLVVPAG
jgi:acyl-CoA thioesterase FadM